MTSRKTAETADRRREKAVFLRLNSREHALLQSAADAAGMRIPDYLRVSLRVLTGTLPGREVSR